MTLEYEIKLPTANEYMNKERTNRQWAAEIKANYTKYICIMTKAQTRKKITGLNDLVVTWVRKDRYHDPDNIYFGIKFLLDGIVSSRVLETDGRKSIRNIHHNIEQGETEKVIITFNEVM